MKQRFENFSQSTPKMFYILDRIQIKGLFSFSVIQMMVKLKPGHRSYHAWRYDLSLLNGIDGNYFRFQLPVNMLWPISLSLWNGQIIREWIRWKQRIGIRWSNIWYCGPLAVFTGCYCMIHVKIAEELPMK